MVKSFDTLRDRMSPQARARAREKAREDLADIGGVAAMPTAKDSLKDRLGRYREITISVLGRKSGRKISVPVWFVLEGSDTLYLMPVQGSDTQWYRNALHHPKIRISARGEEGEFQATPVTDPKVVESVIEAFRAKYGAEDVKKYYSKFNAVVRVDISRAQSSAR